ncbi:DUF1648 domain-containing protein [Cohnella suwonensis]|uniref:DUF1648 domain-containing protein n=1 Tax=Cohnella suwonensis TaxID=696072 RepID=A0ABW0LNR8_9BACL
MSVTPTHRPKLDIPVSPSERALRLAGWLLLIGTFVYVGISWVDLPSRVPMHFNGRGEIDGWGSKWTLWIVPVISAILFIGLNQLSRIPHKFNYPVAITADNAAFQYALSRRLLAWVNLEMVAIFAFVAWVPVHAAEGGGDGIGPWSVLVILAVIIGTLAIYMVRAFKGR